MILHWEEGMLYLTAFVSSGCDLYAGSYLLSLSVFFGMCYSER